ncbi:MAG: hypothetical protein KDA24_13395 [Deltaproteobacteria bacterium]|nr:hypothetical protein [Deltaproteobacteria bacterium]
MTSLRSPSRLAGVALLLSLCLGVGLAEAEDTDAATEIDDTGTVVGTVTLASAPSAVLAKVSDPAWVARLGGGDSTTVEVASTDGDCQILDYVSEHPIATAEYRVRQCLLEGGTRTRLVESEAFSTYEQSWTVSPSGAGTHVTYRLQVVSTLPVPQWMVRRSTKSSVHKLMKRLGEAL